jgi:DNA-binding IclR family transcriptional regulator
MKQDAEAYPGTQAVQRAMSLLKAVAAGGPEPRLTELAREVGLNKTTTFRLLSALESAQMIERTPANAYRLVASVRSCCASRARATRSTRRRCWMRRGRRCARSPPTRARR